MAFLGSNIANEVGLRLLFAHLVPTLSFVLHVVLWALACLYTPRSRQLKGKMSTNKRSGLSIGQVGHLPYGSFSLVEVFSDKILYWVPFYYHLKFAFLVWLQLPLADGAKQLYNNHLRPFFTRHQASVDQFTGLAYGEMVKLIYSYQAKVQFAKTAIKKISGSVNHMLKGPGDSDQPQGGNSTDPQIRTIFDIESDTED